MQLILIPHATSANSPMRPSFDLTAHLKSQLPSLDGLFAESAAGGRRWLKSMQLHLPLLLYDQQTSDRQLLEELGSIRGQVWGLVSDAGYPCVADPGHRLVHLAREIGFQVTLMPGTSAITAAIALCGLPAQRFTFHGYLPHHGVGQMLRSLEQASRPCDTSWQGGALQLFIETPYRHLQILRHCLELLAPSTWLCVASELGNEQEQVRCYPIEQWRARLDWEQEREQVAIYLLMAQAEERREVRRSRCPRR